MKAITFQGPRDLAVENVDDPVLQEASDVIVEVELSAVCGSDLHVYHARETGLDRGTVMGHEFVGRVLETGGEVRDLKAGQSVLSPFTTSCGACYYCRAGLTARCTRGGLFGWVEGGVGLHGAQAERVRVPLAESTLLPIPDGVSPEEGLLLGDVFSTGYFCALRGDVTGGGVCVVIGCGPVGLSAILGAHDLGAERVFAVDSVTERLEIARTLGATPIDYTTTDPASIVAAATEGRGADTVLELVGNAAAHRTAIDLVRPGGTVSVVGVHNEEHFSFTPTEAYDKNLTYRVGRCPARQMAQRLLPTVLEKRFDLTPLISHRFPLDQGVTAYEWFDEKRDGCIKAVLEP